MIGRDFSKNGLFSSYHEKEYTLRLQVSVARRDETRGEETVICRYNCQPTPEDCTDDARIGRIP